MPVITEHHVNFYDTDAMAVVHHSNYIRWFEIGRVEYLRAIGITLGELMEDGFVFPITDVCAKYVSPGRFDDVVRIETTPTALTKAKMAFDYRIFRKSNGELMVTGHSQNVFTRRDTGVITRLPEKYYSILEAAMQREKAAQSKERAGSLGEELL